MGNIEKFDQMAYRYDTPERIEIAKIITDKIRTYLTNGKEKNVVDYGCGTGLVGIRLVDDVKSMLFIDASSNMIETVKQKLIALSYNNAKVLCCDFEKGTDSEIHTDYVIVAQTLLHIKKIQPILKSLYSILNDSGHLFIIDFDKNDAVISNEVHNGFEQEKLAEMLIEVGFRKVRSETFYHGKNMFMNKDASLFILDAEK